MDLPLLLGRLAGVAGLLVSALAVAVRIGGHYILGGFQVGTLLLAGVAAMVVGCLALLWSISARR